MPNKPMHTNRRQAFQFRCSGFFGRWIRSRCPSPAAVGGWNMSRSANKRYAPNPAMTSLFQIDCHRRRVGDTFR